MYQKFHLFESLLMIFTISYQNYSETSGLTAAQQICPLVTTLLVDLLCSKKTLNSKMWFCSKI